MAISRPSPKRLLLLIAVGVCAAAAAMLGGRYVALIAQAEQFVADVRTATLLPPEPQDADIVIVGITEDTLARFPYRSPVDREFLGKLLERIAALGPKVIAIDVLFDQPTEPEKDAYLREALAKASVPLVVGYTDNPQIVDAAQKKFLDGFVPVQARARAELIVDPIDGAVRWIYPGTRGADGSYMLGFARAVAHKLGIETPEVQQEMVWHGRPDRDTPAFRTFPAHFVAALPAAWFKDKVVLIGETVSLTDRHRTPFAAVYSGDAGELPGVEIHAHAIAQLIEGRPSPRLGLAAVAVLTLCVAFIGLLLGVLDIALTARIGIVVVYLTVLWATGFAIYHYANTMIPLVTPTIAFLLAVSGGDALTGREARRQREFIQSAFSRYLSPQLVKQLIHTPQRLELGGEMREMTLMFSDVRGFTAIAERFDAHGLTSFINRFLTPMTDAILAARGTIDKYMGDAIMAFWNAPLEDPAHAENACRAALAMRSELVRLNQAWRAEGEVEGKPFAEIRIGIGLNTGTCCVGNLGSAQRFDYSVLGDDVNLASRFEGQSNTYGVDIVVGERTATAAAGLAFLELDLVRVKGKTRPARIFTLIGDEQVARSPTFALLKAEHDAMLAAYRARHWAEALARVAGCRAQAPPGLLGCYALYEERIAACGATPPPVDWDGVFVALTK